MHTNVFIDNEKMHHNNRISTGVFLVLLLVGALFAFKFNFFQSLFFRSLLSMSSLVLFIVKIIFLYGYFFLMIACASSLKVYYALAAQKEPFLQIHNAGLTFIQKHGVKHISWNQVESIKLVEASSTVTVYFMPETDVENCFPFAKFGEYKMAVIANVTTQADELLSLLLNHQDQFNQLEIKKRLQST